jgi:hypothetical protein
MLRGYTDGTPPECVDREHQTLRVTTPTVSVWRGINWRRLAIQFGIAVLVIINLVGLYANLQAFLHADIGFDWVTFERAGRNVFGENLYNGPTGATFRYSPFVAMFFAAITPLGYLGWTALHLGALLALPRRMALLALVTFPFWNDVYNGNTMTFVFVAAVAALTGSRLGTIAFLALCLLIPRPLMLPVLGYLLWTRREWVLPFTAMFIIHAVAVWLTGWGPEWIGNLTRDAQPLNNRGTFGPSLILGWWYAPIGLVLAAWLTVKGRLGIASVVVQPYWLSHYFIMLLLELLAKPAEREVVLVEASRRRGCPGS